MGNHQGDDGNSEDPTEMATDQPGVHASDNVRVSSAAMPTRLSINIAQDTLSALQEIANDKAITVTEAVRRLIGYGIIVYRANKHGHEILLRSDQKQEKIILID
jgi:hypothetical protein